jgi:competence protein ComEA
VDPLDVNRASAEELARLLGVGRALAGRIVETREAAGPFASVDDLRRVPGLGRARVERLRAHVVSE